VLKLIDGEYYISAYKGELTPKAVAQCAAKLKKAFPTLQNDFFETLYERLQSNHFTNERAIDAINYVIDNCIYPQPTIAQVISFDKREKLLTYQQMLDFVHANRISTEQFDLIKIDDKKLWRRK
jgi:hypothetical protein